MKESRLLKLNRSSIAHYRSKVLPLLNLSKRQQHFVWFEQPTCLGLRFTKKADDTFSVAWVYQGRVTGTGKTVRKRLDTVYIESSDDSLRAARAECLTLIDMARKGTHPAEEIARKNAQRIEKDRRENLIKASKSRKLRAYYDEYIDRNKCHWGKRHEDDHRAIAQAPGGALKKRGKTKTGVRCNGPLFEILELSPSEFKREVVRQWMLKERQARPARLASAMRLLRAFIRWLDESEQYHGLIDPNVVKAREIGRLIPRVGTRDNSLQDSQLRPFMAAVFSMTDRYLASRAIVITLLLGGRIQEILSMKWENIDLKWDTLKLKDKVEGYRIIPMTRMVRTILAELKTYNETKKFVRFRTGKIERVQSEYVFFSERSESGHMEDIKRALQVALARSGINQICAHDLRRTYTTLSEWESIPQGVIAQLQGHKPTATIERHYKKRSISILRKYAQQYEDWLVEKGGIEVLFDSYKLDLTQPTDEDKLSYAAYADMPVVYDLSRGRGDLEVAALLAGMVCQILKQKITHASCDGI